MSKEALKEYVQRMKNIVIVRVDTSGDCMMGVREMNLVLPLHCMCGCKHLPGRLLA